MKPLIKWVLIRQSKIIDKINYWMFHQKIFLAKNPFLVILKDHFPQHFSKWKKEQQTNNKSCIMKQAVQKLFLNMYLKFLCIFFNVFFMVYSLRIAGIKSGLSDFEVKTRRTWAHVKETHPSPLNAVTQAHLNLLCLVISENEDIFSSENIFCSGR